MEQGGHPKSKTKSHNIIRSAGTLSPAIKELANILDAFKLFLTDGIIDIVVRYTNQYAETVISEPNCSESLKQRWHPSNPVEMRAFMGVLLLTGAMKSQHESYEQHRSPGLGLASIRATMSLERFKQLLRFIRFDDKTTRDERRASDILAPIRDV